jgi:hypothetical protein
LQDHPDRADIITENPKLTQNEAQKMMRDHKQGVVTDPTGKIESGKVDLNKNNRKWVQTIYKLAREACRAADIIGERTTPKQERSLRNAIDPLNLPAVKMGGEALLKLHDYFETLVAAAQAKDKEAERDEAQIVQPQPDVCQAAA